MLTAVLKSEERREMFPGLALMFALCMRVNFAFGLHYVFMDSIATQVGV